MATEIGERWAELGQIVREGHIHAATPADAIDNAQPHVIIEPGSAEEVAAVLRHAGAARLRIAPRGGGTKMDWGNAPSGIDLVLSTARLNRVLEHVWDDMTATVEAGCTVARFQQALAEHGQQLALDPLWPSRATIGGVLATNDSGALRLRFGALRDLIIGITIVLPGGTIAKSGGKVVKNVAGYDLPKLLTGSLGTLGIITAATFRLYPLARGRRTLSFRTSHVAIANKIALAIHDSTRTPTGIQLRAGADESPQLDVRFEGVAAAIESQTQQLLSLTGEAEPVDPLPGVWSARESLWEGAEPAVVCKLTLLPTQIGEFCETVRRRAEAQEITWRIVAQSIGVCLLRLEGRDEQSLLEVLESLRAALRESGGSLVVLRCPPEIKAKIDIWGTQGDALPLMRRIKGQFDPANILNPKRFVGGI